MNVLSKIIENKRREIEIAKKKFPINSANLKPPVPIRDFKNHIKKSNKINLIAEIKRRSPSCGVIREEFDPISIAKQFGKVGASALSILTDKEFFGGDLSYINLIKGEVKLPILRKDFIIDEYQIYESVYFAADAILLIADILSLNQLKDYIKIASGCRLSCLVESHTSEHLMKSLRAGADTIGINNRDLRSFEVNLDTTKELMKNIPKDKIVVSESGIRTNKDVAYLESLGVDAVLIGEVFMQAEDIVARVKEIMGY